jgi:uncharacterized protein
VPSIAVDAGPLVALLKGGDNHHADAVAFLQGNSDRLVTNLVVVAEVSALLSPKFVASFLEWAMGSLDIDHATVGDMPRIIEIMKKYADLPADFADASLIALCERRGLASIATLDKDFDVYRTADRKRLRNVFFDR